MPAGKYNITIEPGATFDQTFRVLDADLVAVDLTNVVDVRSQYRERVQSTASVPFATSVSDAANGQIAWTMDAATTSTITNSSGVYDLEIEWNDGKVERILEGDVLVALNVTR